MLDSLMVSGEALTVKFDRDGTIDWQGRQHQIDFMLTPFYGTDNLDFDDALDTLKLTYRDTLLYTERNAQKTTGLDALAVRPAQPPSTFVSIADPALPIAPANQHMSLDAEGLVLNDDGTYVHVYTFAYHYVSDIVASDSGPVTSTARTSIYSAHKAILSRRYNLQTQSSRSWMGS